MSNNPEDILENRIQRGSDAARILEEPLLVHVLQVMEKDLLNLVSSLPPSDYEGRDVYWRELGALASFRAKLRKYVLSGKEAELTLMQRFKKSTVDKIKRA